MSTQAPRRFRRLAGATAALALAVSLAGCGANVHAETAHDYDPAQGQSADSGQLSVRSAVVVAQNSGTGTLVAVLINDSDEPNTLTAVDVAEGGRAEISGGTITIPAHGVVEVGFSADNEAKAPAASVIVTGKPIALGEAADLTFTFASSPSVEVQVVVVPNEDEFADIAIPTPSPAAPAA